MGTFVLVWYQAHCCSADLTYGQCNSLLKFGHRPSRGQLITNAHEATLQKVLACAVTPQCSSCCRHLKLLQVAIEHLMCSMDLLLAVDGAEQAKDNTYRK